MADLECLCGGIPGKPCTVLLRPLGLHCALLLVSAFLSSPQPLIDLGMTGTPQSLAIQATSADDIERLFSKAGRDASLAKCQNEGTLKLACLLGSTSRAWIMDDESDDDDD